MSNSSINFLLIYFMLLFIYAMFVSAIVEKSIDNEGFPHPPIPLNQTGNFLQDSVNSVEYMGDSLSYYFSIIFFYDPTLTLISGFMMILSIIAVFILMKEIIIPLIDIIIPDWL